MAKLKYSLVVLLLLGVSEPAYAHGEQLGLIIYSHVLTLAGVPIVLHFFHLPYAHKVITFMGVLLAVIAMWVVPGSLSCFYMYVGEMPLTGTLMWIGTPVFIGAFALYVSMRARDKANNSLHQTREEDARR